MLISSYTLSIRFHEHCYFMGIAGIVPCHIVAVSPWFTPSYHAIMAQLIPSPVLGSKIWATPTSLEWLRGWVAGSQKCATPGAIQKTIRFCGNCVGSRISRSPQPHRLLHRCPTCPTSNEQKVGYPNVSIGIPHRKTHGIRHDTGALIPTEHQSWKASPSPALWLPRVGSARLWSR